MFKVLHLEIILIMLYWFDTRISPPWTWNTV